MVPAFQYSKSSLDITCVSLPLRFGDSVFKRLSFCDETEKFHVLLDLKIQWISDFAVGADQ